MGRRFETMECGLTRNFGSKLSPIDLWDTGMRNSRTSVRFPLAIGVVLVLFHKEPLSRSGSWIICHSTNVIARCPFRISCSSQVS
ncbi:hypothetical protein BDV27DRAFT_129443 [Aspergillus caelatus]|uniref:Uncharacterized protein n=1 Tax=Aspergillus caelatus TaxID=61420 RepID=A0A5N7A1M2_9EURO|nr:uncharacterized protein BDV27DRAFT_129443 [Aspergillus caelatus]KAE8363757.1 hypothetical protein BDV27DRAFT_129443 [Aspergillus caelatus]